MQLADAWKNLTDDAFVRDRRFECVIGLPLLDERRVCLGALVVGRRDAMAGNAAVLDGLRVIAHRLALDLELRRVRDQGRARGLQDALTGLPNRLLFNDRLESTIQEAHRTGEMFAVLFVDLDRFKNINDSLGHAVGDQVLIAVSKRLRAQRARVGHGRALRGRRVHDDPAPHRAARRRDAHRRQNRARDGSAADAGRRHSNCTSPHRSA